MSDYRNDFRSVQREFYWSLPRITLAVGAALVALCVIVAGLNYYAYGTFAFFAPKYEAVRRDVMIESRAYSEATTRRLYELKLQYDAADENGKATIRSLALHEARAFDRERLPRDLQLFLMQLGG